MSGTTKHLVGVFGLAAGHLAKFVQTALTVHPELGSYDWYFVPAYLLMILIVPVTCYVAVHFIRRFVGLRWTMLANILSATIVIAGAAFLLAKTDFAQPFRYVDRASKSSYQEWGVASYSVTLVMNRVLAEDSVIGSWDSGVVG